MFYKKAQFSFSSFHSPGGCRRGLPVIFQTRNISPLTQYDVHKPMFIAYLHIEAFSFFQPKSVIHKKENQAAGTNLTA